MAGAPQAAPWLQMKLLPDHALPPMFCSCVVDKPMEVERVVHVSAAASLRVCWAALSLTALSAMPFPVLAHVPVHVIAARRSAPAGHTADLRPLTCAAHLQQTVEWDLLLFFASMFAMIEASAGKLRGRFELRRGGVWLTWRRCHALRTPCPLNSTLALHAELLAPLAFAEIGMIGMIAGWLEDAIRAVPEGSRTIVAIQARAGAGRCCCSRAASQLC